MGGSFGDPEVLIAYPAEIVSLTAPRLAAARTSVFARAPGIECQRRSIVRTNATVHRQECFLFRNHRCALDHRLRALAHVDQQGAQIGRSANDLRASRQLLGRHHVLSPSPDQENGSTRAPAFSTAAAASRRSPFRRKIIEPPAPAPAAFPPSAPTAATARSSCAIADVRIPASSAC